MTEPDAVPSPDATPVTPAAASPPALRPDPSAALQVTLCLIAIVVGLALRLGHAQTLGASVAEFESDGFVMAFAGRPWDADNRVRAPGHGLLLGRLSEALSLHTTLEVRQLSIGLSLLALLAAFQLAASGARITGMQRRSVARACAFVAVIWAVHPTLVRASVTPTPEVLTGGALCLALAALCRHRHRPGPLSWLALCVGASLAVVVGGVAVAAALVVGLVVYLLPVPGIVPASAALGAVAVGLAAGWFAQAGSLDSQRPWLPDSAGARSVLALLGAPAPHPNDVPIDADVREFDAMQRAADAALAADPLVVGLALAERAGRDVLGPRRLEPLLRPAGVSLVGESDAQPLLRGLALWDVFLRGGLLLFALAVVGMARRKQEHSSWPRAGVMVGALALALLLVAGAVGPLAAAPLDLLLLGAAGAGMASADPSRPWTRRLAFAVGGVLTCTFLITAGVDDRPLSAWAETLDHSQTEGALLVGLLDGAGPTTAMDHRRAATLLSWPAAPFLRRDRSASVQALEATKLDPDDSEAVELLIRSQAAAGQFAQAAQLAEGARAATNDSLEARTFELLLDWVQKEQRDARLRRP